LEKKRKESQPLLLFSFPLGQREGEGRAEKETVITPVLNPTGREGSGRKERGVPPLSLLYPGGRGKGEERKKGCSSLSLENREDRSFFILLLSDPRRGGIGEGRKGESDLALICNLSRR